MPHESLARKRRVVVADDEPLIRELVSGILTRSGFEVVTACNGHEALELLQSGPVDVLITDIRMPGPDGLELVDAARELSPGTSSILITGNASLETARGAARHGAYDYVTKPFSSQELLEAVHLALSRKAEELARARERELQDLFRLSEEVRSTEDPWEMAHLTVTTAVVQTHSDAGCLAVMRGGALWPYLVGDLKPPGVLRRLEADDSVHVATTRGTPLLVTTTQDHPLRGTVEDVRHKGQGLLAEMREVLIIPLSKGRQPRGAVAVARRDEGRQYTRGDYQMLSVLAGHLGLLLSNLELVEDLQRAYLGTVHSMALVVEAKDRYTRGHSKRVAELCWRVAHVLGLGERDAEVLRTAADLHDLGKVAVPDHILNKTGALTKEEWHWIRQHPVVGADALAPATFLAEARPLVLYHHERYDGAGYPFGKSDGEISLLAHILIAADAWDAMTSHRPYRPALSLEKALQEMKDGTGTQFHPDVSAAMVELFTRAA